LSHIFSPFCSGYFGDEIFKTISPGSAGLKLQSS
jgi:hypothetical protein